MTRIETVNGRAWFSLQKRGDTDRECRLQGLFIIVGMSETRVEVVVAVFGVIEIGLFGGKVQRKWRSVLDRLRSGWRSRQCFN